MQRQKNSLRRAKLRERYLALPGVLGFLLCYVLPFGYSVYFALIDSPLTRRYVGIRNFASILQSKYYRMALQNTLTFTAVSVPILVALSFVIAVALMMNHPLVKRLRGVFLLPYLLPSASVALVMGTLFTDKGLVPQALQDAFGIELTQRFSLYVFFIWKSLGLNVILFMAGFASIPPELYEAAMIDGAGTVRRHLAITLPLIVPTGFFVLILSLVNSLRAFKEAWLLYGSYPDDSIYMVQHYMNNQFYKLNYQNLAAGAILFAFLVYLILGLIYRLEDRLSRRIWS